jgi:hypothetical protein
MLIFRADDRYLLGFPLAGNRVREHFHLDLSLASNGRPDKARSSESAHEDQRLANEVRGDLTTHFQKIWESARPFINQQRVFEEVAKIPLNAKEIQEYTRLGIPQPATVEELLRWACASTNVQAWRGEVDETTISNRINEFSYKLKSCIERIQFFLEPSETQQVKGIALALKTVIVAAVKQHSVSPEKWSHAIADELSHEIANGVGFEDLAEAIFFIRHLNGCVPEGEISRWKTAWINIEHFAEHWAQ